MLFFKSMKVVLKQISYSRWLRVGAVVLCLLQAMLGMAAGDVVSNSMYRASTSKFVSIYDINRFLAPQAMPVTAVAPIGEQTSGAQYSAARLQTGSLAKVQSYGECSGYSYGGGDSHAAYNSSSISNGNVSQYSIPTIGVRSTLRGKAYASADEAYDAATSDKRILKAPPSGPITDGDTEKPTIPEDETPPVPVGDAPWLILVVLMIAYTGMKRWRTVVSD